MDKEHEERERLRGAAAQSLGIDPDLVVHQCRRSQSIASSEQYDSVPTPWLPPFPASLGALSSFIQMSATFHKFSPASLLTKQWKYRRLILTSHVTTHRNAYLFKSASRGGIDTGDNQNSAMFVADEEVDGRRHVIKSASKDVGTKKNGTANNNVSEDPSCAMWYL